MEGKCDLRGGFWGQKDFGGCAAQLHCIYVQWNGQPCSDCTSTIYWLAEAEVARIRKSEACALRSDPTWTITRNHEKRKSDHVNIWQYSIFFQGSRGGIARTRCTSQVSSDSGH